LAWSIKLSLWLKQTNYTWVAFFKIKVNKQLIPENKQQTSQVITSLFLLLCQALKNVTQNYFAKDNTCTFSTSMLWTKSLFVMKTKVYVRVWPSKKKSVQHHPFIKFCPFVLYIYRVRVMVFNATFNNISVISWRSVLLVEETRVPTENHWPAASHWQTFLYITYNRYVI
jgi:hypothetical protein